MVECIGVEFLSYTAFLVFSKVLLKTAFAFPIDCTITKTHRCKLMNVIGLVAVIEVLLVFLFGLLEQSRTTLAGIFTVLSCSLWLQRYGIIWHVGCGWRIIYDFFTIGSVRRFDRLVHFCPTTLQRLVVIHNVLCVLSIHQVLARLRGLSVNLFNGLLCLCNRSIGHLVHVKPVCLYISNGILCADAILITLDTVLICHALNADSRFRLLCWGSGDRSGRRRVVSSSAISTCLAAGIIKLRSISLRRADFGLPFTFRLHYTGLHKRLRSSYTELVPALVAIFLLRDKVCYLHEGIGLQRYPLTVLTKRNNHTARLVGVNGSCTA